MLFLFHVLKFLALSSTANAISRDSKTNDPSTISIYAWPLSQSAPLPITVVNPKPSPPSESPESILASLFKYSPPTLSESDDVVRIGILDSKSKQWTGTAVSRDVFASDTDRKFLMHLDEARRAWSVSLFAEKVPAPGDTKEEKEAAKKDKKKGKKVKEEPRAGRTSVEVVTVAAPPEPVLNKPIQLNLDGKVPETGEENKTFLQKYWWAIVIFLLVNLVAGGGGDDER